LNGSIPLPVSCPFDRQRNFSIRPTIACIDQDDHLEALAFFVDEPLFSLFVLPSFPSFKLRCIQVEKIQHPPNAVIYQAID
jgi:hypothetical protein